MSGKILITLFIALSFCACARPIYEKSSDTQSGPSSQEKTSADCRLQFKNSGLCLTWSWEKKPTETQAGSLIFKTFRINNYDQTIVSLNPEGALVVLLWMPSMGHGSSPTSVLSLDIGTFRASQVFFVMPGEWEIKFQIKNENTVVDEIIVPVII